MTDALKTARLLAATYGHRIDGALGYMQGVAISGRLRLAALEDTVGAVSVQVAELVAPVVADPAAAFDPRLGLAGPAGAVWAEEMYAATGDRRYADFLIGTAATFDLSGAAPIAPPFDADVRVEDCFFAGALLGRASRLTGDDRYLSALTRFLLAVDTQQSDGLFRHCHAAPFLWGRGNGFAALGFAETLTYMPADHPQRAALLACHLQHLRALRRHQHSSGMWHQVIDDERAYLEHSATTMITCAIARGIRRAWLDRVEWMPVIDRAWPAIAKRVGPGGEIEQVCIGTGPLADREAYRNRAFTVGRDDRGGAMALWCAVETERLARTRG